MQLVCQGSDCKPLRILVIPGKECPKLKERVRIWTSRLTYRTRGVYEIFRLVNENFCNRVRTFLSPRSFRRKPGSDKQRLRLVLSHMKREGEVCDFIVGRAMKRLFPIVFAATFALAG